MTDPLDTYEDNFGMIREMITNEVSNVTTRTQTHRGGIIIILLNQSKDEVCGSISKEVAKAAAGRAALNPARGRSDAAQVMASCSAWQLEAGGNHFDGPLLRCICILLLTSKLSMSPREHC